MDKFNSSDTLVIGYDQSDGDIPVLTIGRTNCKKIEIIKILGGESATTLYSRMISDHNDEKIVMLMAKNNGRSMIRRHIAEMFNVETKIPRGNGKSRQDMEDFIDRFDSEIYNAFKVKGELL